MSKQLRIKRLFHFAFGALAMLAVALLSAFLTMRLAIHGREVEVPSFSGLTVGEATQRAAAKGLSLNVENHFYSASIAAGHIMSQLPTPGETVRRDTQVRVAESLGLQRVSIPDVIGQSERSATIAFRRLSLELGTVSHLATDTAPDVVLGQTPPPNSENIDGPHVSLLVSEAADGESRDAFVMPSLTGLSPYAATVRVEAAGLHVVSEPDPATAPPDAGSPDAGQAGDPSLQVAFDVPSQPTGNVVSQYPVAGHRVVRGQGVHLAYAHPVPLVTPADATSGVRIDH